MCNSVTQSSVVVNTYVSCYHDLTGSIKLFAFLLNVCFHSEQQCVVLFRVLYTHSYLCQGERKEVTAE